MRIRWRGLELPSRVVPDRATLSDTYGKFTIEPFERGLGVTVGNSLRRILLSGLEGSAITQVKIRGVAHEITSIPGVVEDVMDIILNIKSLVVRNTSDQPKVIRIERSEKGTVFAKDIITDATVQIINPEHVIATLTDDIDFHVELTVANGRGYRAAEENIGKDREIGVIPWTAVSARWPRSVTRPRTPAWASGPTTTSWFWKSGPTGPPPPSWRWLRPPRSSAST